ncbi:MAG TPA: NAD-dependent epimerase/dehydratase family protein [Thermoleophilaceae bacterium]|nr:NAD-dependent epimerase/dehydratase family protein [Thermoleophilaceae bacterium]
MPGELSVAVTGPTGDLGLAIVSALERSRRVERVVGMARRPFDPGELGWKKTEYRRGDVTDDSSVRELVKGADVVIHLAFAILTAGEATRELNVEGSRRVFQAAATAGVERILYASSVAAYGFHQDNPDWLSEGIPARGSPEHPYSQQKAEVERVLGEVLRRRRKPVAYAFRPCVVAGPRAQTLLDEIPYYRLSNAMPEPARQLLASTPVLKPVIPDPGTRFQLVHEDDVAAAFMAGVAGKGEPGPYNLAAAGVLTLTDLTDALGWYALPVPGVALEAAAEVVTRLPLAPDSVSWLHSLRKPVLMKTDRARKELGWRPRYTAKTTLRATVEAHRARRSDR